MEPEAASIYCQHLTKDNEQNSSVLGQLGVGEKYMVVDLGGECLIATSRVIPTSEKKLLVCNDGVHDIHLNIYIYFFFQIFGLLNSSISKRICFNKIFDNRKIIYLEVLMKNEICLG